MSNGSLFPAVTYADWRAKVEVELEGQDFSRALTTKVAEGVSLEPLYSAPTETLRQARNPLGTTAGWHVCTRYDHGSPADIQRQVMADLENGATALWFTVGAGLETTSALEMALGEVVVEAVPIFLPTTSAEAMDGLITTRDVRAEDLELHYYGRGPDPGAVGSGTSGSVGEVDAHLTGADCVQELGLLAARLIGRLRRLEEAGTPPETVARQTLLRISVGRDLFTGIAKLRAARVLWASILAGCGVVPAPAARIHAVTSDRTLTRRDPWVNMLRVTTQTVAAAAGGADFVTTAEFDRRLGYPSEAARRLARNTQSILGEESALGQVLDPAGGSYYVEQLTAELAAGAWEIMQELERRGGSGDDAARGWLDEQIAETRMDRDSEVATRSIAITGVSEFANLNEVLPEREAWPERANERFALAYDDSAFESLRSRTEAMDPAPTVFLANLGSLREHKQRATFSKNFFAAGGIRVVQGAGTSGSSPAEEVGEAFSESGLRVACICGSDGAYEGTAVEVAAELKRRGTERVLLAGPVRFVTGDVDDAIHLGCDAVGVLTGLIDG